MASQLMLAQAAHGFALNAARIYGVCKLRIGFAITLCALAGMAVASGAMPGPWQVAALAFAVLLSSASAGAFNQLVERDVDALMERTRNRPFVNGTYRAGAAWYAAIGAMLVLAVGLAAIATNAAAALYVFLGAFFYGVVYTVWLKRRSVLNIVVGGLAGSFAVLAGAAAVDPDLGPVPLIFAVVLFLWTPPHFWSLAARLREDYAAASIPMLPVVVGDAMAARVILAHTVALAALSIVPAFLGLGPIYLVGALVGGGLFVRASIRLARNPGPELAMANFHASLIQLSLLLVGAIADRLLLV